MSYCVYVDYEAIEVNNSCKNGKKFTGHFLGYLKSMESFRNNLIEGDALSIARMSLAIDGKMVAIEGEDQLPMILELAQGLPDCAEYRYNAAYHYICGHISDNVRIMKPFTDAAEYFADVLKDDMRWCVSLKSATEPEGVGDDEHIRLVEFGPRGFLWGEKVLKEGFPQIEGVAKWGSGLLDFGGFHGARVDAALQERIRAAYDDFKAYDEYGEMLCGPETWEDEGAVAYPREQNVSIRHAELADFIGLLERFAALFKEAKGVFGVSCWLFPQPDCNPPVFIWITDDGNFGTRVRHAAF